MHTRRSRIPGLDKPGLDACPHNPTASPRSFRPVDAGVGWVVMAVLEAEPIVVIAGWWCGPEGCGSRRSRNR